MKKTYCDACNAEANQIFKFAPTGGCGDSFCWNSCDLRSCKGATYDWCGSGTCASRMQHNKFNPISSSTEAILKEANVSLSDVIANAKKQYYESIDSKLQGVKNTITSLIQDAIRQRLTYFLVVRQKNEENSKLHAQIKELYTDVEDWLKTANVSIRKDGIESFCISWTW